VRTRPEITEYNWTHYYCPYWGGNAEINNIVEDTELEAHGHVTCPTPS
jgi:hypothetical protein